jgi:hypothetical protein
MSNVYSLVCAKYFRLASKCLQSLSDYCEDRHSIVLVSDGTLSDSELADLSANCRASHILQRDVVIESVKGKLRGYPKCEKFLHDDIFAMKLIALPILERGNTFAYCDSDIYFTQSFRGLFLDLDLDLEVEQSYCILLRDSHSAYSTGMYNLTVKKGLSMTLSCNAGMILAGKSVFDLDFIEWFLSQGSFRDRPFLVEQTCWAALSARSIPRHWSLDDFYCSERPCPSTAPSNFVGIHFVGAQQKGTAFNCISGVEEIQSLRKPTRHLKATIPGRVVNGLTLPIHYASKLLKRLNH